MTENTSDGMIRKMRTQHKPPVRYQLPVGDTIIAMNPLIGKIIKLTHSGNIFCVNCARKISKSFNQGYCYPCFRALAECDLCIMRPELCHFDQGTCRDETWGLANCMQPHFVYLANSSGLKVGITRHTQIPTRWIDQGASQAMGLFKVKSRYISGLIEVMLKAHISDRTDWRKMLKGPQPDIDLAGIGQKLFDSIKQHLNDEPKISEIDYEILNSQQVYHFEYPVQAYPEKIKALNFDKTPCIEAVLMGIKGQYLIFDCGVLNVRKFGGYEISLRT